MSLKNEILKIIRSIINPIGYDIVKYRTSSPPHIVLDHLRMHNIQTVLDVGANTGQYSNGLRKAGYKGRIISFEPASQAYHELKIRALRDKNWQTFNLALGEANEFSSIHISRHSPRLRYRRDQWQIRFQNKNVPKSWLPFIAKTLTPLSEDCSLAWLRQEFRVGE